MKIKVDKAKFAEKGQYNERNLVQCKCGKHFYPSKKMFVEFLKQYEDVDAEVDIWSLQSWNKGTVTIFLELTYAVSDLKEKELADC